MIVPDEIHQGMARVGKSWGAGSRIGQAVQQFAAMRSAIERIAPRRLLDIGCGFGIIDVLIAGSAPVTTIHLLDGNGSVESRTGFKPDTQPWFDVRLGEAMVRANVADHVVVFQHFVGNEHELFRADVDFVISCRSWGHHYPVSVYLPLVRACLRPGGHVLLDIRNRTDGMRQMLGAGFVPIERIPDDSAKCERWLFQAP